MAEGKRANFVFSDLTVRQIEELLKLSDGLASLTSTTGVVRFAIDYLHGHVRKLQDGHILYYQRGDDPASRTQLELLPFYHLSQKKPDEKPDEEK